jgi:hypothetical protein
MWRFCGNVSEKDPSVFPQIKTLYTEMNQYTAFLFFRKIIYFIGFNAANSLT